MVVGAIFFGSEKGVESDDKYKVLKYISSIYIKANFIHHKVTLRMLMKETAQYVNQIINLTPDCIKEESNF